jgi:hypothetical protein
MLFIVQNGLPDSGLSWIFDRRQFLRQLFANFIVISGFTTEFSFELPAMFSRVSKQTKSCRSTADFFVADGTQYITHVYASSDSHPRVIEIQYFMVYKWCTSPNTRTAHSKDDSMLSDSSKHIIQLGSIIADKACVLHLPVTLQSSHPRLLVVHDR